MERLKENQANEGEVHSFEIHLADFAYLFQLHAVNSAGIVQCYANKPIVHCTHYDGDRQRHECLYDAEQDGEEEARRNWEDADGNEAGLDLQEALQVELEQFADKNPVSVNPLQSIFPTL